MITYNKGRKTAILDDSAGQACICLQRYQHLDGRRSRDRNMAAPMKWERESSIRQRFVSFSDFMSRLCLAQITENEIRTVSKSTPSKNISKFLTGYNLLLILAIITHCPSL